MTTRTLVLAGTIALAACSATPAQPETPASATTTSSPMPVAEAEADAGASASLDERFVAALTSCEVRASCCPDLDETRDACDAGTARRRERWRTAIGESQLLASGAARFDPDAVAELESNVASCVPLLEAPWFLNSMIIGTVPDGGNCGDGNLIDTAGCVENLFCDYRGPVLTCGVGSLPVRHAPPTTESTYCRPFDEYE